MTKEMVGWHHQLNGHESEQAPGDGEGQGSLACCSPQGCKKLDMTEQLNNNCVYVNLNLLTCLYPPFPFGNHICFLSHVENKLMVQSLSCV